MGKDFGANMSKASGAKRLPITQNGARKHPRLTELHLQQRGRLKPRRIYNSPTKSGVPRAPRNTSSFIMDAKRKPRPSTTLVSPVTPSAAARFAASVSASHKEGLDDEVEKEWGVDSYGSMNGLITRLRSVDDGEREGFGNSNAGERESEQFFSHAESVQKLEQRIDHHFEIVWPPWRSLGITSPKASLYCKN